VTKYRAVPTYVGNIRFPSKAQAQRYSELKLLERAGVVSDLNLEVPFDIVINGKRVAKYIADFVYLEGGNRIVEDKKGMRTPVYRLKKKNIEALYGITIRET